MNRNQAIKLKVGRVKKKLKTFLLINLICVFQLISQNQLPIQNGEMEATENGFFSNWQTQANNVGNAIFSISTDNLIPGSTKALFYPNGIKIYETLVNNKKTYDLKTSGLSDGVYLVKIQSKTKSSNTVVKFIKK